MNLPLARKLLLATEQQPGRRLSVRDRDSAREIQMMIDAGLVQGKGPTERDPYSAQILTITDEGLKFLRALRDLPG